MVSRPIAKIATYLRDEICKTCYKIDFTDIGSVTTTNYESEYLSGMYFSICLS